MNPLILALRPKHWVKNLFVLVPLLFGHKLFYFPENINCLLAAFLFSMMASSVYLWNDIYDRDYDRLHAVKRLRPIASGTLGVKQAAIVGLILSIVSLVLAFKLNIYLFLILLIYLLSNLAYTVFLKRVVIVDVFCLAFFYLLRILAGNFVADVGLSYWMILETVLLAMFLGFHKRRYEIGYAGSGRGGRTREVLGRYSLALIDQILLILTTSMAVVYLLYTTDERTVGLVGSTHLLFSAPFVYYGIFRYLYLAQESKADDPTALLFSDRVTQINLALWVLVCSLVLYLRI